MNIPDSDRFTWLLVTLASCGFVAGLLSLFVPKAEKNVEKFPASLAAESNATLAVGSAGRVEINIPCL